MLPNFLVVGAEKAGTTWLYERLRRHPDIYMPLTKEIHFFSDRNSNLEHHDHFTRHGLTWYKHFFQDHEGESAVGEVTPMYLCDEKAPERIRELLPDVRIIACLRHPVDRAYSHYWMARGKNHTDLSFEEVVRRREPRFIERGRYGEQLARYYDLFEPNQILVLIHEEVFSAPSQYLNKVCSFLEVDNTFFQDQEWISARENSSATLRSTLGGRLIGKTAKWMRYRPVFRDILDGIKRTGLAEQLKRLNRKKRSYPPMRTDLRHELSGYFEPQIRQTEKLIGRKITVWPRIHEEQKALHG
jgi:hypothetical protein